MTESKPEEEVVQKEKKNTVCQTLHNPDVEKN